MNWCMLLGHSAKGRQQIDRTWKNGKKEGRDFVGEIFSHTK